MSLLTRAAYNENSVEEEKGRGREEERDVVVAVEGPEWSCIGGGGEDDTGRCRRVSCHIRVR